MTHLEIITYLEQSSKLSLKKMYHTIHTLDVFNLYLSIPNLSIALEKPKTLDETQLCF